MARRRVQPLAPDPEALPRLQRMVDLFGPVGRSLARPIVKFTMSGQEHFPHTGPVLLLTNHQSAFDAGMLMVSVRRPIQFMVTQAGMSGPAAQLFATFGAIPKQKFSKDSTAVRAMKRWRDAGAAVGLFPEGQRSWDGRPLELISGIEKLVRLVNAPLVTGRIYNADRVWPRWAVRPRRGRVHIELDPPVSFARQHDPKDIRQHVERHVRVDPHTCPRWPVRGLRLAEGLANLIFACPGCNGLDVMEERGDLLCCPSCGNAWTVGTDNVLRRNGEASPIDGVWRKVKERFAQDWVGSPARFARDGVVLESEPMRLWDVTEEQPRWVGQGRLRLRPDGLHLGSWQLPMDQLTATSVEFRRRLQFRANDGTVYEAEMPRESVVKWEWVVPHWQAEALGT